MIYIFHLKSYFIIHFYSWSVEDKIRFKYELKLIIGLDSGYLINRYRWEKERTKLTHTHTHIYIYIYHIHWMEFDFFFFFFFFYLTHCTFLQQNGLFNKWRSLHLLFVFCRQRKSKHSFESDANFSKHEIYNSNENDIKIQIWMDKIKYYIILFESKISC